MRLKTRGTSANFKRSNQQFLSYLSIFVGYKPNLSFFLFKSILWCLHLIPASSLVLHLCADGEHLAQCVPYHCGHLYKFIYYAKVFMTTFELFDCLALFSPPHHHPIHRCLVLCMSLRVTGGG